MIIYLFTFIAMATTQPMEQQQPPTKLDSISDSELIDFLTSSPFALFNDFFRINLLHNAISNERLTLLLWLRQNASDVIEGLTYDAAARNKSGILDWLLANHFPVNDDACGIAMTRGFVDVLHVLHARHTPYSEHWGVHPNAKEFLDSVLVWREDAAVEKIHFVGPKQKTLPDFCLK